MQEFFTFSLFRFHVRRITYQRACVLSYRALTFLFPLLWRHFPRGIAAGNKNTTLWASAEVNSTKSNVCIGTQLYYSNWHAMRTVTSNESDVYWTVHHCDNWWIKNRLDVICYFIVILVGSTCFGQYSAHHQELATMMFITTLVVSFLVCCMLEVRYG